MSVDELIESEDGKEDPLENITIEKLVSIYGREAVIRGLSYMDSLVEAEKNYKRATLDKDEYAEGYLEGHGVDDDEVGEKKDKVSEAASEWEKAVEGSGLGLNNEGGE